MPFLSPTNAENIPWTSGPHSLFNHQQPVLREGLSLLSVDPSAAEFSRRRQKIWSRRKSAEKNSAG